MSLIIKNKPGRIIIKKPLHNLFLISVFFIIFILCCTKDYGENIYPKNLNSSSNFNCDQSEKILNGFKNIKIKFIIDHKYIKIIKILIHNEKYLDKLEEIFAKYKQIENLDKNKGDKILYFPIVFNFNNIGERDYSSIYVQVQKDNFHIVNPWSNSIKVIRFDPKLTPQISFFENRNFLFVKFTPPNYESDERIYCLYSINGNKVFEKKGHELDKFFFSENLKYCIYAKYSIKGKNKYILQFLTDNEELSLGYQCNINSVGVYLTKNGNIIIYSSKENNIKIFDSNGELIDTVIFNFNTNKRINYFDYDSEDSSWVFGNNVDGFVFYSLKEKFKRELQIEQISNAHIINIHLIRNLIFINVIKNKESHLIIYDIKNNNKTDVLIQGKFIKTKKFGNNLIIQNLNNIEVYEVL